MTYVTSEPYIGHMGLGGVGDSKGLMESELRQRHIKWITNAKVAEAADGKLRVQEMDEEGKLRKEHELPFRYAMILPAFRGVDAVAAVPDAPQMPYATPTGMPARSTIVNSTNEPT